MDVYVIIDETESYTTGLHGTEVISVHTNEWSAEGVLKQIAKEKNGRYLSVGDRSYVMYHDDDGVTTDIISHVVGIYKTKLV